MGSLWSDDGAVSSVFTSFYVDHAEPLEALKQYKAMGQWGLGGLLDGHEFLAIFPVVPLSPILVVHLKFRHRCVCFIW
jgi:hypothetical protein